MLPWLPGFPPQAFPTISSLTSPQSVSPQSTAALALGLLHNPQISAPSLCAFLGICVPVRGMYGISKDCLILIPFRLPQISCFTLSLKCFSSDSDNCPDVGIGPLLQLPHWPRAGPVLLTLLFPPCFLPLTEFCMGLCIFLSTCQVLLSALSWCSACTSVSEGIFLMLVLVSYYQIAGNNPFLSYKIDNVICIFQVRQSNLRKVMSFAQALKPI